MKKILFLFHLVFATAIYSQSWHYIGNTAGIANASEVSMKIASDGTIYVAYIDTDNNNKVGVKKWVYNQWILLSGSGVGGFNASGVQLELVNDLPVVAAIVPYTSNPSIYDIQVNQYNGTSWIPIYSDYGLDIDPTVGYSLSVNGTDIYLTYNNLNPSLILGLTIANITQNTRYGDATQRLDQNAKIRAGLSTHHSGTTARVVYSADLDMEYGLSIISAQTTSHSVSTILSEVNVNKVKAIKGHLSNLFATVYSTSGANKILYMKLNGYPPALTNATKIDSSATLTHFDFEEYDDDFYIFYNKGNECYLKKAIGITGVGLTFSPISSGPSLAPNNASSLQIRIHNNIKVIAYISSNKLYVKEMDVAGNIEDWQDFRACEGNTFNNTNGNNEIYILDANYSSINVSMTATSQNTAIIPNSGISINPTAFPEIFLLNVTTINDVSSPTTVDFEVKMTANGVVQDTRIIPFIVYPKPDITFVAPVNNLCKNAQAINISSWANPVGGSWMGAGVSNNIFHPSLTTGNLVNLTYTKTNQYGCTNSADFPISINPIPVLNVSTTASACDENTGTATVTISGGATPYATYWSSGSSNNSAANLAPGHYVVTVTDGVGCTTSANAMVASIGLTQSGQITHVTCPNTSAGAIDVSTTGGIGSLTYLWSNGATTEDISGLAAGAYDLTIQDEEGCISTATYIIEEPTPYFLTSESKTTASCGQENGGITVTYTGGTAPLTYVWKNLSGVQVGTSNNLTNVGAGIYTCVVTDINGCEFESTHTVSNNGGVILTIDTIIHSSCANDGSITLETISGTPDSYLWSTGATTASLTNQGPGHYAVQVTDLFGCVSVLEGTIEAHQPEEVQICLVTVDETTNKNLVVWEKPNTNAIDHFNIYRETSQAGIYQLVGSVSYPDESIFSDPVASPNVRSWRYKIASVDACGVESELSTNHKTIHLVISQGLGNDINLFWDSYEGFTYSEFVLKRHTNQDGWEDIATMPTNLFTYTDQPTTTDGLMYIVTVQSPTTCTATTTKAQDFNTVRSNRDNRLSTGEEPAALEKWLNASVSIHPNPATDYLIIQNSSNSVVNGTILDQTGRVISHIQIQTGQTQINCEHLASGMYQLELQNEQVTIQKRFVIKK